VSAREAFETANALELRVLSGCHTGARVPALDGLSVGADENADVVLTDLDPSAGQAVLQLHPQGGWSLRAPEGQAAAVEQARPGVVRRFGGLALSVAAEHSDWPRELFRETGEPAPQEEAAPQPQRASLFPTPAPAPEHADGAPAPANWRRRLARAPAGIALAALAILALGLALLPGRGTRPPPAAVAAVNPQTPVDTAGQQRQMRDIQLTIAQINPALRLRVQPLPDGRVRVSGWVGGAVEWDRLAEALGGLRPMPLLQVHELGELRDELRNRLGLEMSALEFEATGAAGLRVTGLVQSAQERADTLAALRALLPADVELVDGLGLAEKQAQPFAAALRAAGFPNTTALWDGEQVLAGLSMTAPERGRLEQTLAQLARRFRGLHFTVDVQLVHLDGRAEGGPLHAVPMDQAGLPFQIRGVVGGASPFVLLGDGSRLIVGGSVGNWRLQAVEAGHLLFDGPRRVAVLR